MRKNKLNLTELKVVSFITNLTDQSVQTIKGGSISYSETYDPTVCDQDSEHTDHCTIENSVYTRCSDKTGRIACASNDSQQNTMNNCSEVC